MQRWFKEGVQWRKRALSHENGMGKVGVGAFSFLLNRHQEMENFETTSVFCNHSLLSVEKWRAMKRLTHRNNVVNGPKLSGTESGVPWLGKIENSDRFSSKLLR